MSRVPAASTGVTSSVGAAFGKAFGARRTRNLTALARASRDVSIGKCGDAGHPSTGWGGASGPAIDKLASQ
eukprot:7164441-Pyramimonas_sp.AAC.1